MLEVYVISLTHTKVLDLLAFARRNVCNYKSKNAQHTHQHEGQELLKASYTSSLGLQLLVYEALSCTEHTHQHEEQEHHKASRSSSLGLKVLVYEALRY